MIESAPHAPVRQGPSPRLRPSAVAAGVLAAAVFAFGPSLGSGLPRVEACGNTGCTVSIDWLGLLPHPAVLLAAVVLGLAVAALVLAVGLLWSKAAPR